MPVVSARLPVRLVSNREGEHWTHRSRRAKDHRQAVAWMLCKQKKPPTGALIAVDICRLGRRRMDDDNLTHSAKNVRDGVAAWIGVDDADPSVTYTVTQHVDPTGGHGVLLTIAWPSEIAKE